MRLAYIGLRQGCIIYSETPRSIVHGHHWGTIEILSLRGVHGLISGVDLY